VPKQFLNILHKKTIQEVELGDAVKIDLTAMFADIRNFTHVAEQLKPERVALLLNTYLGYMTPIISQHHGFVAHFLGDGILALFTRASDDAVKAALEMQIRLTSLNNEIKSQGFEPINMGIGLNYGPAMLSILGAEERIDANVISDAINTASRIEGLNKFYKTRLLISEPVYQHLNNPNQYLIRCLGRVKVKGKSQSMRVYEVKLHPVESDLLTIEEDYIRQFERGVSAYEQANFTEAISIFTHCLTQKPEDDVVIQLLERTKELDKTGAPADWSGDISMPEK
jgi:class 3 adenylate cyclase